MPKLPFKALATACALSVGALTVTYVPAEAGGRHHRHHRGHSGGSVAAAAIAGLAIGAIVAGSASRRSYAEPDYYYAPPPPAPRYYAPPVSYSYGSYAPRPWTPEWYDYCSSKYVSFDPRSGTFQPYYGPRRLCQ